jgi:hypothetical protein
VSGSVLLAALIWWSWQTSGRRSPGFVFLLTWLVMTWVGVTSRVISVSLPSRYYTIKHLERSGRLYERLGVRVAKRLLRRGPLAVFNPTLRLPTERNASTLADLDAAMRHAETGHVISLVPILLFGGYAAVRGWPDAVIWSVIFNVVVNGYPIMLQRYNRNRLGSLVARAGGDA